MINRGPSRPAGCSELQGAGTGREAGLQRGELPSPWDRARASPSPGLGFPGTYLMGSHGARGDEGAGAVTVQGVLRECPLLLVFSAGAREVLSATQVLGGRSRRPRTVS